MADYYKEALRILEGRKYDPPEMRDVDKKLTHIVSPELIKAFEDAAIALSNLDKLLNS